MNSNNNNILTWQHGTSEIIIHGNSFLPTNVEKFSKNAVDSEKKRTMTAYFFFRSYQLIFSLAFYYCVLKLFSEMANHQNMRNLPANRIYENQQRNRAFDADMSSTWFYNQGNSTITANNNQSMYPSQTNAVTNMPNQTQPTPQSNPSYYPYQTPATVNYSEYTPTPIPTPVSTPSRTEIPHSFEGL